MTTVAKRRRGARLPAVQLRAVRRVPPRQRHALRAARLHRPVGGRRLRGLRARRRSARCSGCPPGVEPAEVAPHADAGLTAYHAVRRVAHLLAPGTTAAVIGVGGVGHIALQLVRELGVEPRGRRRHGRAPSASRRRARRGRGGRRRGPAVRESDGRSRAWTSSSTSSAPTRPTPTRLRCSRAAARYSMIGYGGTLSLPSKALVVERARGHRQPRRHVDRPVGDPAAPRRRADHAEDGDAPARAGERRAREAAGRRGHRPRRARARVARPFGAVPGDRLGSTRPTTLARA